MRTRLFIVAVSLLCLFVFASCSDDDPVRVKDEPEDEFPALTDKDNVFAYLEMVYEKMNIDHYPKLLDENFIFWFSAEDFNQGTTPEQWGRAEELACAAKLFGGYAHPQFGAVTGIDLQIVQKGLWIEVPKTEPPYAGETWYQRAAEYYLIVETTSEWTLQCSEKNALFTVRQSEVDGENIYRIVLWNDDIQ